MLIRKFASILSIAIALSIFLPSSYSHAADCTVIKKSILSEEDVGYAAWMKFDAYRKGIPNQLRVKHIRDYVRLIKPVHASDRRVFALINANTSCFTSKITAFASKEEAQTKSDQAALDDMVTNLNGLESERVIPNATKILKFLREYYAEFWEILANKRMSKAAPKPSASPSKSGSKSDTTLKV